MLFIGLRMEERVADLKEIATTSESLQFTVYSALKIFSLHALVSLIWRRQSEEAFLLSCFSFLDLNFTDRWTSGLSLLFALCHFQYTLFSRRSFFLNSRKEPIDCIRQQFIIMHLHSMQTIFNGQMIEKAKMTAKLRWFNVFWTMRLISEHFRWYLSMLNDYFYWRASSTSRTSKIFLLCKIRHLHNSFGPGLTKQTLIVGSVMHTIHVDVDDTLSLLCISLCSIS